MNIRVKINDNEKKLIDFRTELAYKNVTLQHIKKLALPKNVNLLFEDNSDEHSDVTLYLINGDLPSADVFRYVEYYFEQPKFDVALILTSTNSKVEEAFDLDPIIFSYDNSMRFAVKGEICPFEAIKNEKSFDIIKNISIETGNKTRRDDKILFSLYVKYPEFFLSEIKSVIAEKLEAPSENEEIFEIAKKIYSSEISADRTVTIKNVGLNFADLIIEGTVICSGKIDSFKVSTGVLSVVGFATLKDRLENRYSFRLDIKAEQVTDEITFSFDKKKANVVIDDADFRNIKVNNEDNVLTLKRIAARPEYSVSVVVYDIEDKTGLDNTISSIFKQSYDFLENIQIIFVSENLEIIQKYKNKFPYNVSVSAKKENKSSSLNKALDFVLGNYATFVRSGDTLDTKFLKIGVEYFKKNANKRLILTSVKDIQTEKFLRKIEKTTSLNAENKEGLTSLNGAIFKSEIFDENLFNEEFSIFEDLEFLLRVTNSNYATVDGTCYNSIAKESQSDAVSEAEIDFVKELFETASESENASVFIAMLPLFFEISDGNIANEIDRNLIFNVIDNIDELLIEKSKDLTALQKSALICLKNNSKLTASKRKETQYIDVEINKITRSAKKAIVFGEFSITASLNDENFDFEDVAFDFNNADATIFIEETVQILGIPIVANYSFELSVFPSIDEDDIDNTDFLIVSNGYEYLVNIIQNIEEKSFYIVDNYFMFITENGIKFEELTEKSLRLFVSSKMAEINAPKAHKEIIETYLSLRKTGVKTNNHVFSDGSKVSNSVAARLFGRDNTKDVPKYYICGKSNADKIPENWNKSDFGTSEHYLNLLFAEVFVTTSVEDIQLFENTIFKDLSSYRTIYIPGKILDKKDIVWLEKITAVPDVILLSSGKEIEFLPEKLQNSVVLAENIKLQYLQNKATNGKIIFTPTVFNDEIGKLLNNEELFNILQDKKFQFAISSEEEIMKSIKKFGYNPYITFEAKKQGFAEEYSLLITDNSTVYDFAFLEKPVVYFTKNKNEDNIFGDSFGNTDEVVTTILELAENGFIIPNKYKEISSKFFSRKPVFETFQNCVKELID
ncbi:hypothetical protein FACS1894132_01180 [Clostridia bacterium]|nr:hypothetical protein FACS1894132_01180 [Clostridia bacterium]